MFAGPIIAREVLTAPRPARFYLSRAAYAGLFFILMWTAWQSLIGWRDVRDIGVIAVYGASLFRLLVILQLVMMLFFAPLAAATSIAHEKDRRTFLLLLMTDLRDVEIVLGKLVASLLQIATLLAVGAPILFLCMLLGGASSEQVLDVLGITAAAGIAGGATGLLVALWRDRTFQSLAMTLLVLVLGLTIIESVAFLLPGLRPFGVGLADLLDPFRTVLTVTDPAPGTAKPAIRPSILFMIAALLYSAVVVVVSVVMLRVWNPGRNEPREQRESGEEAVGEQLVEVDELPTQLLAAEVVAGKSLTADAATDPGALDVDATTGLHVPRRTHRRITKKAGRYRSPWETPIIWRELMTRAYGTKPLVIKAAYLACAAVGLAYFYSNPDLAADPWRAAWVLIPLSILSLILINAQGVTSITSERDTGALDLLLVTELSPSEFIFGKLYGVLYNTKEMVAVPVLLTIWFALIQAITVRGAVFLVIDFLLLAHFSAKLGIHAAITYTNSRTAVANSLGTIFFLMVGIAVCAGLIVISDREFGRQLLSFVIFIGAGSVALFASLGAKNPSRAIALVALLTPFWSFYCIISLAHRDVLAAFLVSVGVYGFALMAMLVPAVSDFDIALGRTNAIQG
ncbi:MAG: hypothetical protein SFX72_21375 [Isosphaeraceae bacterium]|nr:hypothetical protein [Isosphaeraceae bacterium]